jgi:hypothetical protein
VEWSEQQSQTVGAYCCGGDNSANAEGQVVAPCDKDTTCSGNGECTSDGSCSCAEGFSGDDCGTYTSQDNMNSVESVDSAQAGVKLAAAKQQLKQANAGAAIASSEEAKAKTEAMRAHATYKASEDALTNGQGALEDKMSQAERDADSAQADMQRSEAAFEAGKETVARAEAKVRQVLEDEEAAKAQLASSQTLDQEASLKAQAATDAGESADEAGRAALEASTKSTAARQKADQADKQAEASKALVDCDVDGSSCERLSGADSALKDAETDETLAAAAAKEAKNVAEGETLTRGLNAEKAANEAQVEVIQAQTEVSLNKAALEAAGEGKQAATQDYLDSKTTVEALEKALAKAETDRENAQTILVQKANAERLSKEKYDHEMTKFDEAQTAVSEADKRLAQDQAASSASNAKLADANIRESGAVSSVKSLQANLDGAEKSHKEAEVKLEDARESGQKDLTVAKGYLERKENDLKRANEHMERMSDKLAEAKDAQTASEQAEADATKEHEAAAAALKHEVGQKDAASIAFAETQLAVKSASNMLEVLQKEGLDAEAIKAKLQEALVAAGDDLAEKEEKLKQLIEMEANDAAAVRQVEQSDKIQELQARQEDLDRAQAEVKQATSAKTTAEKQLSNGRISLTAAEKELTDAEHAAAKAETEVTNGLPFVIASAAKTADASSAVDKLASVAAKAEVEIVSMQHSCDSKQAHLKQMQDALEVARAAEQSDEKAAADALKKIGDISTDLEGASKSVREATTRLGKSKETEHIANEARQEADTEISAARNQAKHQGDIARAAEEAANIADNKAADRIGFLKDSEAGVAEAQAQLEDEKAKIKEANKNLVSANQAQVSAKQRMATITRQERKAQDAFDAAAKAKSSAEADVDAARKVQDRDETASNTAADAASTQEAQALAASEGAAEAQHAATAAREEASENFNQLKNDATTLQHAMIGIVNAEHEEEVSAAKKDARDLENEAKDKVQTIKEASVKVVAELQKEYNQHAEQNRQIMDRVDKSHEADKFADSHISKAKVEAARIVEQAQTAADKLKKEAEDNYSENAGQHIEKESDAAAEAIIAQASAAAAADAVPAEVLLQLGGAKDVDEERLALERIKAKVLRSGAVVNSAESTATSRQNTALDTAAAASTSKMEATDAAKKLEASSADLKATERAATGPRERYQAARTELQRVQEDLASVTGDEQTARATMVNEESNLKAAQKKQHELGVHLTEAEQHVSEVKVTAEQAVADAKNAKAKADGERTVADDESEKAEAVDKKNAAVIKAAQDAATERREDEVASTTSVAREKELEEALPTAKAEAPEAQKKVEASTASRKEAEDAVTASKVEVSECDATLKAKQTEHEKFTRRLAEARDVKGTAQSDEDTVSKAQEKRSVHATKTTGAIKKAERKARDSKHNVDDASTALESAISKLEAANAQTLPARDALDEATENAVEESAELHKRRVAHENSVALLNAGKAAIAEVQKQQSELQDELEAATQGIEDSSNRVRKQEEALEEQKTKRGEIQGQINKATEQVTELTKEEDSAEKAWQHAQGVSEKNGKGLDEAKVQEGVAKVALTASEKEKDDAAGAIKSIDEENETLLKMPEQVVSDTTTAIADAQTALATGKTEKGRAETAQSSAEEAATAAAKVVKETQSSIVTVPGPSKEEYENAKAATELAKREVDAAAAAHDRIRQELEKATGEEGKDKKSEGEAEAALIATEAAKDTVSADLEKAEKHTHSTAASTQQDIQNLEDAQAKAASEADDAETKLGLVTEATKKRDEVKQEHDAKTAASDADGQRFKMLDSDAKAEENLATAAQSAASTAGSTQANAEQAATAAKQAAKAALETAKKLESAAAADKLKLDGKVDAAVSELQPLQDELSKARERATSAADERARVNHEYEIAKQQKKFAYETKTRTDQELVQAQEDKRDAVSKVNEITAKVHELSAGAGEVVALER